MDILREESREVRSGFGETYKSVYQVVLAPEVIETYKQDLEKTLGYLPKTIESSLEGDIPSQLDYEVAAGIGTAEYKLQAKEGHTDCSGTTKQYLHTQGVIDCIALIAFNTKEQKSVLYHISKMDLAPQEWNEDKNTFEEYFIPSFHEYFKDLAYQTFLISSVWSKDVPLLANILKKHNIFVDGMNIPNCAIASLEKEGDYYTQVFVDTKETPYLENPKGPIKIISTSVYFDTTSGKFSFKRD